MSGHRPQVYVSDWQFRQQVIAALGRATLDPNADTGFLYIPACNGTPTGTPIDQPGRSPIVVDSANNKLYFFSGGAWRDAGP